MCCFIVPMVQAAVTSACRKHLENKGASSIWAQQLPTLEKILWGGTAMLIVDHIINGEVSWRYPFFTALGQTGGAEVMLHEMLTVGVPMSVVATAIWAVYTLIKKPSRKKANKLA